MLHITIIVPSSVPSICRNYKSIPISHASQSTIVSVVVVAAASVAAWIVHSDQIVINRHSILVTNHHH